MKIKIGDTVVIIIFLMIIAVSFLFVSFFSKSSGNNLVYIKVKDTEYVYPLDKDCILEFDGEMGKSVLEIQNGAIRFLESTCFDSTCIKMGEVGKGKSKYIACLPNMVIVTIKGENSEIPAENGVILDEF